MKDAWTKKVKARVDLARGRKCRVLEKAKQPAQNAAIEAMALTQRND
jgi:hypothetical protein